VSTDKWPRCCRKPKPTEVENDDQKDRREKAEQLKTQISKMSSAEKAAWYVKQKEERRKQEKRKRSFNSGVGFAQESVSTSLANIEKDIMETCDDWCLRQMQLKRFDTLEAAQAGFKEECQKPGAKTTQRRGETLQQGFAGVEVTKHTAIYWTPESVKELTFTTRTT